jgi:glycosyltransferase involved in cell wall biosynthesis
VRLSVVIPVLGRHDVLRRVLTGLREQCDRAGGYEVLVVSDAAEPDPEAVDRAAAEHGARALRASRPGASAARNAGWRAARAPVVLFLGADILPSRRLLERHAAHHARHPEPEVAVLGRVRWAREGGITTFMRWLDRGVQFDYPNITDGETGWGSFYTANVSVKRGLLERAGGFDEEGFPFLYEDLELAYRLRDHGLRLLVDHDALGEHLHPTTLEDWKRRIAAVARAERRFSARHPDVPPYFYWKFRIASEGPPARGRGMFLAPMVPPRLPVLGPYVWGSVDTKYSQALAPAFLQAWEEEEEGSGSGSGPK